MTEREFSQDVNDYYALRSFCYDYGCDICDNVIDREEMNECVESVLARFVHNYTWQQVRDMLQEIDDGYDWYYRNNVDECEPLDYSDFAEDKVGVYEWALENYIFDEADEEEDEEEEEEAVCVLAEEPEEEPVEEEDFSISELMGICAASLATIQSDNSHRMVP